MIGEQLLVDSLSTRTVTDSFDNRWQYHSRSDAHSKAICWGMLFDIISESPVVREQIRTGRIGFGINHEMVDGTNNRKKRLDLVLCVPRSSSSPSDVASFSELAAKWGLNLSDGVQRTLQSFPVLRRAEVGRVVLAVEAKACMTAHSKARPRLYDELASAHQCINGASSDAVAIGHVVVNASERFFSSDKNKRPRAFEEPVESMHRQPDDAQRTIEKLAELPIRSDAARSGYDGLAVTVIDFANDGTPARLVRRAPAPPDGDARHYESVVHRVAGIYNSRFRVL